jgi:hypothetical protein
MSIWKNVNPSGALSDFVTVFRDAGPKRWPIAALSAFITLGMVSSMALESWKMPRALPEVTYITSFPEDWSDEESKAFRTERQRLKEERAAYAAKVDAETKQLWKSLGRASGMDVDAIERKAEAERKAEEKAKAEKEAALVAKQAGSPPVAE